jgi:hypothetical protein
MGGTGGSQMQRSGGNHNIVGRGPENGRGVYNRQERHHGHFRFLIPGGGYGYCDNPDLIGTPNWLIYCEYDVPAQRDAFFVWDDGTRH